MPLQTRRVQLSKILCPVDLSEPSRLALDYALMLAGRFEATVTVLEVVWAGQSAYPPLSAVPALSQEQRDNIHRELADFIAPSRARGPAGITVNAVVMEGPVARQIIGEGDALPADLIVLGTHGYGGFEHLLLGSVAERVLRKAACPVLTIPASLQAAGPTARPFRTVLCPVDFSPASLTGVSYALSLAEEENGRVVLAHVQEWPADEVFPAGVGPELQAYRRQMEARATDELRALVPDDARNWCRVDETVVRGKPYEAILRLAGEVDADLIAMGVHGRRTLVRHVFGSTADHVIREAECPVITVRP